MGAPMTSQNLPKCNPDMNVSCATWDELVGRGGGSPLPSPLPIPVTGGTPGFGVAGVGPQVGIQTDRRGLVSSGDHWTGRHRPVRRTHPQYLRSSGACVGSVGRSPNDGHAAGHLAISAQLTPGGSGTGLSLALQHDGPLCSSRPDSPAGSPATSGSSSGGAPGQFLVGAGELLVFRPGGFEQATPGGNRRAPLQPAVHARSCRPEYRARCGVRGVGEALGAHRTAGADGLGPVLVRAFGEQLVRISGPADRSRTSGLLIIPDHPGAVVSPVRPAALFDGPGARSGLKNHGTGPRSLVRTAPPSTRLLEQGVRCQPSSQSPARLVGRYPVAFQRKCGWAQPNM